MSADAQSISKTSYLLRPSFENAALFRSGDVEALPSSPSSPFSVLGQPRVPKVVWRSSVREAQQLGKVVRPRDEPGFGAATEVTNGITGHVYDFVLKIISLSCRGDNWWKTLP